LHKWFVTIKKLASRVEQAAEKLEDFSEMHEKHASGAEAPNLIRAALCRG
jgi:hypothetical protein